MTKLKAVRSKKAWEKPQWECDLAILMGKLVGWREVTFDQPLIYFIRTLLTSSYQKGYKKGKHDERYG
jgi:hypothetical protein